MTKQADRALPLQIPLIISAYSGFCVMMIELVASRMVAGYIGASLHTWTAVIGVIFTGMTVGHIVGGRLSDRCRPLALLSALFAASALACFLIQPMLSLAGALTAGLIAPGTPWTTRTLVVVFLPFFLPGAALGAISPAVARWALAQGYPKCKTVGCVYSANVVGSILGTFVTGFYLVDALPTPNIVMLATGGLLLAALIFFAALHLTRNSGPIENVPDPTAAMSTETTSKKLESLLLPCLLVFFSGFCVMLIELCASRMAVEQIGHSLYTWTAVLGVILAGLSVGNVIGGKLADRHNPRILVGGLYLFASFFCMLILQTHYLVNEATAGWLGLPVPWFMRVLIVVLGAFFLPAMALGTLTPAVVKWSLDAGRASGRTLGTLYAWNSLGSILGTFATGFFLITVFYVSRLVALTSVMMAIIAMLFLIGGGHRQLRRVAGVWLVLASIIGLFACMPRETFNAVVLSGHRNADMVTRQRIAHQAARYLGRGLEFPSPDSVENSDGYYYYDESSYFNIRVLGIRETARGPQDDRSSPRQLRRLDLDTVVHGYVDIADPQYLHYAYEHIYSHISNRVLQRHREAGQVLRTLFIGGGAYTYPRYQKLTFPEVQCDISEIDPKVTLAVQEAMGLAEFPGEFNIVHADARQFIMQNDRDAEYDIVYGDAFSSLSVPSHLTTVEFTRDVARLLKPDGLYMINMIDSWRAARFLSAFVNTLEAVFEHVHVFSTLKGPLDDERATFVLLASKSAIDLDALGTRTNDFKGITGRELHAPLRRQLRQHGLTPLKTVRIAPEKARSGNTPLPAGWQELRIEATYAPLAESYTIEGSQALRLQLDAQPTAPFTLQAALAPSPAHVTYVGDGETTRFVLPPYTADLRSNNSVPGMRFYTHGQVALVFPSPPSAGSIILINLEAGDANMTLNVKTARTQYALPAYHITVQRRDVIETPTVPPGATTLPALTSLPPNTTQLTLRTWTANKIILTDAHCPVDNMLSEVVSQRAGLAH
ncbi:MAG: fused MFS/spermidine synthase [Verrucomicrobia bacterium]|nr:fused MFS/spermidine synthase [Verrucomicrobiota bacterium]